MRRYAAAPGDGMLETLPASLFMVLVMAWVIGGAIEDVFYRGFIQTPLAERWGRWPAIGASAAIFGLAHSDVVHSTLMVLMGLLLGWLVEVHGSIRPAIVAHVGNNTLSCLWTRFLPGTPLTRTAHGVVFALGLVIALSCLVRLRKAA